jgi:hypothetical protein
MGYVLENITLEHQEKIISDAAQLQTGSRT